MRLPEDFLVVVRQLQYLELVVHLRLIHGLRGEEIFIVVLIVNSLPDFYGLDRLEAGTGCLLNVFGVEVNDFNKFLRLF